MKALFLTTILPYKKQIGSEVASQALIDRLQAEGVALDVVGYVRPDEKGSAPPEQIAVHPRYIETRNAKLYPAAWMLQSLASGVPYTSVKYCSEGYSRWVKRLTKRNKYDFAVIDHPQMGWIIRSVLDPRIPIVFVAHNIEHEMYEERAQAHDNILGRVLFGREARLIKEMEHWLARSAVEVWTLTAHDAAHFKRVAPATKVREMQIPGSAKPRRSAAEKTIDIALIGSWSWAANREALDWFLDNVRPKIPHGVSIHIAGKGADHLHGKYPNVHYAGFVPDSIAFLQSARVVAIPTLTGGGIQIKTLDAIASGSRIVATACAARGLAPLPATVKVVKDEQSFARELVWATGSSDSLTHWGEAITWCMERERNFGEQIRAACTSLRLSELAA